MGGTARGPGGLFAEAAGGAAPYQTNVLLDFALAGLLVKAVTMATASASGVYVTTGVMR